MSTTAEQISTVNLINPEKRALFEDLMNGINDIHYTPLFYYERNLIGASHLYFVCEGKDDTTGQHLGYYLIHFIKVIYPGAKYELHGITLLTGEINIKTTEAFDISYFREPSEQDQADFKRQYPVWIGGNLTLLLVKMTSKGRVGFYVERTAVGPYPPTYSYFLLPDLDNKLENNDFALVGSYTQFRNPTLEQSAKVISEYKRHKLKPIDSKFIIPKSVSKQYVNGINYIYIVSQFVGNIELGDFIIKFHESIEGVTSNYSITPFFPCK